MKYLRLFIILIFFSIFLPVFFVFAQGSDLLTEEENLWLKNRNNTIIVYPERNYPPFSYQSPGGNIQGLSVDYLELIAEKLDLKINYLLPQARNQIISELGVKGDVGLNFTELPNNLTEFIFTDYYAVVPTIIVVRKDYSLKNSLNLSDFSGKKISVVAGSAIYFYIKENYPRIVLEDVTDNEVSLQQVVLGEVEASVMDVASLSYFLSKQVLSSVKIAGSTGFDYKLAFMLPKNNTILQSILEKGLMQVSAKERDVFNEKWITLPNQNNTKSSFVERLEQAFDKLSVYITLGILFIFIVFLLIRQSRPKKRFFKKVHEINELKEEIKELAEANQFLAEELKEVEETEFDLQKKIKDKLNLDSDNTKK